MAVNLTTERKILTLSAARIAAQAAVAEAEANAWAMSIAVVDVYGNVIVLERMDGASLPTLEMARGKAFSSANTAVPTSLFEEGLQQGKWEILVLRDITPLQGGLPISIGGTLVGAIAAAGQTGQQNEQCARAGVQALESLIV